MHCAIAQFWYKSDRTLIVSRKFEAVRKLLFNILKKQI